VRGQAEALGAEVIVVAAGSDEVAARIASRYSWLEVVHPRDVVTIPALRQRGVADASGEYIAVIEEHCAAQGDWLATALDAHARGNYAAVGGALSDSDYDRVADWVVYFIEYHGALPPAPDGETTDLNDANIVYRRDALDAHADLLGSGYWPMALHPTLIAEGRKFLSVPAMSRAHCGPFPSAITCASAFSSAVRSPAFARSTRDGERVAYVLGAPLMPFVLFARIAATVFRKRCRDKQVHRRVADDRIALVVLVAGEWVGCVAGPGDALSKVE
jgi:hypothetical protein